MNQDDLLKERKDLLKQEELFVDAIKNPSRLRVYYGDGSPNLLSYSSTQSAALAASNDIILVGIADALHTVQQRLNEITETIEAINTLLSGGKQ
jgi:hypothetical protein